jgi:hypothetical protein
VTKAGRTWEEEWDRSGRDKRGCCKFPTPSVLILLTHIPSENAGVAHIGCVKPPCQTPIRLTHILLMQKMFFTS